jgi:hypothetical protein
VIALAGIVTLIVLASGIAISAERWINRHERRRLKELKGRAFRHMP